MHFSLLVSTILVTFGASNDLKSHVHFDVTNKSTPHEIATNGCHDSVLSCYRLALPLIELAMNKRYGYSLDHWQYNPSCECSLPKQTSLHFIQFFHIPKTGGTAFNYLLHDYVGCPIPEGTRPCEVSVTAVSINVLSHTQLRFIFYLIDVLYIYHLLLLL